MAAIQTEINNARRRGVKRAKRSLPRIDMTPMVDLGFLLITFFIITTELSKPVVVKLNMPTEGPPLKLGMSNAMTILLTGGNTAWYYEGQWEDAVEENRVIKTNVASTEGVRKLILQKKRSIAASSSAEGSDGLMLLIKAAEDANYRNVIDILDEILINAIKKYAVVKMEPGEADWLRKNK